MFFDKLYDSHYLFLYSKYTRIQNQEQLLRYKRDFERLFPEYQKMFEYVENICSEFTELEESIQRKDEDSDEWNVSVIIINKMDMSIILVNLRI